MAQTKTKRTGKNAPHCDYCQLHVCQYDHKMIDKHASYCSHCNRIGHHMSLCYKLKFCNLCGKAGHNPYRCWRYSTIQAWISRAYELDRCVTCLTPWKFSTKILGQIIICSHCCQSSKDVGPLLLQNTKESQTEVNSYILQESQTELQQGKDLIDNQKRQIEEMNSRILSLENKLESSNTTIDSLNWKLQCIIKEKEQELHKVDELNLLCRQKEMELRKVQEQIGQKDTELEQQRRSSSQPYQTIPATPKQPSPTSNYLEHIKETNCIKVTLADLQEQQQKLSVVVNHLFNKIKTQDYPWVNYSSFNPYLGLFDTGQYFNKL